VLNFQQQSDPTSCVAVHIRSKDRTRSSTVPERKGAEGNADSCLECNDLFSSAS
jgi:hypothetical protein